MSKNQGVDSTSPSRRSVVKGAAWAVPAVVVAGAAPTVAASEGPLTFKGGACKLPGNSSDIFKSYVFELRATNTPGPNPVTGVTVITDVRINGIPVAGFDVHVQSTTPGPGCSCATCTPATSTSCNTFCTPDASTQRIFVYVSTQEDSSNSSFSLSYQRFECGTCTAIDATPVSISSGPLSTPPAQGNSCQIDGAVPVPAGVNPACTV